MIKEFSFEPYLLKGMSYGVYLDLIRDLLSEGKTTGPDQSASRIEFTKLNLQRMERLDRTIVVNNELARTVSGITTKQSWLIITEAWCGDAAQNLPLFKRLADLNPNISLRLVLRDENPELMNRYLSNGARAIPIVVATEGNKEVWKWGPRPAEAQRLVSKFKEEQAGTPDEMKLMLHTWYSRNKTNDQQEELLKLIS